MELSDQARQVLSYLAMAKGDAYLVGKPDEETPLSLVDTAGFAASADSMPLIDRKTLEQLVLAGYLEDYTGAEESFIAFRISDKGRSLFPALPVDAADCSDGDGGP